MFLWVREGQWDLAGLEKPHITTGSKLTLQNDTKYYYFGRFQADLMEYRQAVTGVAETHSMHVALTTGDSHLDF